MPKNSLLPQPAIDGVRQQFEAWRQTRKGKTPIPPALWEAAAGLCDSLSVNHAARALNLNHTELKSWVEKRRENVNTPPAFMELPSISPPVAECAIEMENRHGERLLMQFKGNVSLDLLELGKSFWRRLP